jgi:hypothetical protein
MKILTKWNFHFFFRVLQMPRTLSSPLQYVTRQNINPFLSPNSQKSAQGTPPREVAPRSGKSRFLTYFAIFWGQNHALHHKCGLYTMARNETFLMSPVPSRSGQYWWRNLDLCVRFDENRFFFSLFWAQVWASSGQGAVASRGIECAPSSPISRLAVMVVGCSERAF